MEILAAVLQVISKNPHSLLISAMCVLYHYYFTWMFDTFSLEEFVFRMAYEVVILWFMMLSLSFFACIPQALSVQTAALIQEVT